ncbi:MAG TPA: Nif11-like leader peptide family RiPP precursor [Aggregatilineales bacterium]|nr:Nif11-like leader peptide family RiPP precursor [Aggregatilineales bacterium]
MLNPTVMAFVNSLQGSPDLLARVNGQEASGVVKIATNVGFKFSADEWTATMNSLQEGELSEDDLDKAAGGIIVVCRKAGGEQQLFSLNFG